MNIAIVGATGNVGRKILEVIEKINFEFSELYLIASDKSIGKNITFKGKTYSIIGLNDFDFSKVKIAFFSAGSVIAEKWAPIAAKKTVVIDNSKYFRMDKDIPLVVPEVNADTLKNYKNKNIIANANCSTIQLVLALTSELNSILTDSECPINTGTLTHVALKGIFEPKIFFVSTVIFHSSFV